MGIESVKLIQKDECRLIAVKKLWKATWSWMMCLVLHRTHAWVEMSLGLMTIFQTLINYNNTYRGSCISKVESYVNKFYPLLSLRNKSSFFFFFLTRANVVEWVISYGLLPVFM